MNYELNLEWFEDTEFIFNVLESEDDYDSWNDEKVWKSWYNGYQVFVFPIRTNKKIVGYGFDVNVFDEMDRRFETEFFTYNSFINEETPKLYKNSDRAIQGAEKYLKENIACLKVRENIE